MKNSQTQFCATIFANVFIHVYEGVCNHILSSVTSVTNRCGLTLRGLSYTHDDLSRPVSRNGDTFRYNLRGEVSFAQISGNTESHVYDLSGNSTFAAYNAVTNLFTANNLNQYSAISMLSGSAPPHETTPDYDSDGNLITCAPWTYTYDSASRLVSVSSNGVLLVTNAYDYRGRRIVKTTPSATHTFLYDDWNLIQERVDRTDGSTDVFQYFWGRDLSGSLQGAGGIGGLLYMKVNGTIYIPLADANGNISSYVDSDGTLVAEYVYDAFGQTSTKFGPLADLFRHRFSSKYLDAEVGLYYYRDIELSPGEVKSVAESIKAVVLHVEHQRIFGEILRFGFPLNNRTDLHGQDTPPDARFSVTFHPVPA